MENNLIFKNWQDFDKCRDRKRVLVIYGAGKSGMHFLNQCEVMPDYICDRNADIIKFVHSDSGKKIKCLTWEKCLKAIGNKACDILVSPIDIEIILILINCFENSKINKQSVFYFYHRFDIEHFAIKQNFKKVKINGKLAFNSADNSNGYNLNFPLAYKGAIPQSDFLKMRDAYFDSKKLTYKTLEERISSNYFFTNNMIYQRNTSPPPPTQAKNEFISLGTVRLQTSIR